MNITRTEIINDLIEKNGYRSYLEIGLDNPSENFTKIKCEFKESCDPYYLDDNGDNGEGIKIGEDGQLLREIRDSLTYRMESDDLFAMIPNDKKWDVVFIDGLHTKEQVTRDILNSMKHLNNGGCVICHDCLPLCEEHQFRNRETHVWNGDVWKAIARMGLLGMEFNVIDSDTGVGIIPKQALSNVVREKCFDNNYLTWDMYVSDRDNLMHVISPEEYEEFILM